MNILLLSERYDIIYYTEKSIRSAFEEKGIDVKIGRASCRERVSSPV